MSEHMGAIIELWVVAADRTGIWVLNRGAEPWYTDRIMADQFVHSEVELLACEHAISQALPVIHSTSWRQEGPHIVLTYLAIADAGPFVQDAWPDAVPLTAEVLNDVGHAIPHAANTPPLNRTFDVLINGIRHLRYLRDHDAPARAAMSDDWKRHLGPVEPALAGYYELPAA